MFFILILSGEWVVIPHGFNLHFAENQQCWASFYVLTVSKLIGVGQGPRKSRVRSPEDKTPPNWGVGGKIYICRLFLSYPFCFYGLTPGVEEELEAILGSLGRGSSVQPAWLWGGRHVYCFLLLCSLEHLEIPLSLRVGGPASCQFHKSSYSLPIRWGHMIESWLMECKGKVWTPLQTHKILLHNPPLCLPLSAGCILAADLGSHVLSDGASFSLGICTSVWSRASPPHAHTPQE